MPKDYLAAAVRFDLNDEPVAAADSYEAAIDAGETTRDAYVNLAVLYFVCTDGGYAASHSLSRDFLDRAWQRIDVLLDEAEAKFGRDSEIEFWRRYANFILLGQEHWIAPDACIELLRSGDSLVPSFYLAGSFAGLPAAEARRFVQKAEVLLDEVREGRTVRERYLRSVLETVLK